MAVGISHLRAQSKITYVSSLSNGCSLSLRHDLVLPSSLKVSGEDSIYTIEDFIISSNTLTFRICPIVEDSIYTISYRGLNMGVGKIFSHLDSTKYTYLDPLNRVYDFGEVKTNGISEIAVASGLQYNGSFSRGFAVGNSQSLVLNSNFDLQMNGEIGNGIRVLAAISDDNIPIQPEGNTQVLQEFDKVFIEVSKDRTSVIAGDYELRRPVSYFMNFQKKLKGLSVNNISILNENTSVQTVANVASSRGKFARQILKSREGNQGPYRLLGNNNERFIIILSNQEKIYFNGELLKRGLEYDYIIDYNSAEISFTPNRLVAKETRIIAEFEYTDLNYFRSLYHLRNDINSKKYNINVNFYSEQDSKTSTSQIDLDSTDISILTEVGDASQLSFRSGIRSISNQDATSTSNITYEYIANPNVNEDGIAQILTFSSDDTKPLYIAAFSDVGLGSGGYDLDTRQGLNGRVYKYVGKGKGRYDPITQLVAPEKKQMATVGATFRIAPRTELRGEWALTNLDRNRFSSRDDSDNADYGGYIEFNTELLIDSLKSISYFGGTKLETIGRNFNPLNPYRIAEFGRDWNVDSSALGTQRLFEVISGIRIKKSSLSYQYSSYDIGQDFQGNRHLLKGTINDLGWKGVAQLGMTSTTAFGKTTRFLRPNFDIARSITGLDNLAFGVALEAEDNRYQVNSLDSLTAQSYAFDYTKYYIRTNEKRRFNLLLSYNKRNDAFGDKGILSDAIDINEIEILSGWQISKSHRLNISIKNRDFEVLRTDLVPTENSKRTLVGNIDHTLALKALQLNSNYQLASGQEPRLEFVFQKVENNFGDYVYVGSDTAGIKNITDFRYDPTNPLARYIRISLPNSQFISTDLLAFNNSFRFQPAQFWSKDNKSKLRKWTSKIENLFTYRSTIKTQTNTGSRNLNPLSPIDTANTVNYNSLLSNNVFLNKGNPNFDMVWIYRNNALLQNQLNGNESRDLFENEVRARTKLYRNSDIIATVTKGNRAYDAQLFNDRDFLIDYTRYLSELNVRNGTSARYILKYKYEVRNQLLNTKFEANINDVTFVTNLRQAAKSALDLSISYVNIAYDGPIGGSLEYDMLDGLRKGNNMLWNTNFTRRLNGTLDLTLSYEGRKTGVNPAIHIMRAQVKASF